jgi:hypothetical protein
MNTKILFTTILIFSNIVFIGCKKEKIDIQKHENLLIEEFVYNPNGVVFKITNDVDSAAYQLIDLNGAFYYTFHFKIDSIALKKFLYNGPENPLTNNYTWFTKKGQYVCWKYEYVHISEPYDKYIDMVIPNRYKNLSVSKFIFYRGLTTCTYNSSLTAAFQKVFPKPLNDTVYVKLSSLSFNKKIW